MRQLVAIGVTFRIAATLCLLAIGASLDALPSSEPAAPAEASAALPAEAMQPRAGETFRDCPKCPEMVVIPAGTFTMGAPPSEAGFYGEQGPQRVVTIRRFAAGKFDVTKGQWASFVSATKHPTREGCQWSFLPKDKEAKASWRYLSFKQDDTHPVVCVTWTDTQAYLAWISRTTGKHYRLLTEAEWEYAARAGTTTPYPWGSKASHDYANYGRDDEAGHGLALGRDQWAVSTSPVGSFPPNAFGLYDMHGNILQWVSDCFALNYNGLPHDGSAYTTDVPFKNITGYFAWMNGTRSCNYRVLRGGCWADTPEMIRSASRNSAPTSDTTLATYSSSGVGIRVARDLE
jgi:formylglycine-generating enzyme required for sulfatase activity